MILITLYVGGILIATSTLEAFHLLKLKFSQPFKMEDCGDPQNGIGLKFVHHRPESLLNIK